MVGRPRSPHGTYFLLAYYHTTGAIFHGVFTSEGRARTAMKKLIQEGGVYTKPENYEITPFILNRIDGVPEYGEKDYAA